MKSDENAQRAPGRRDKEVIRYGVGELSRLNPVIGQRTCKRHERLSQFYLSARRQISDGFALRFFNYDRRRQRVLTELVERSVRDELRRI